DALTAAVTQARASNLGVWRNDGTTTGVTINQLSAITDDTPILPKLFGRLMDYFTETGLQPGLAGFISYLESHARLGEDGVRQLPNGHATHLDTFVRVTGEKVWLTVPPETLVFDEK